MHYQIITSGFVFILKNETRFERNFSSFNSRYSSNKTDLFLRKLSHTNPTEHPWGIRQAWLYSLKMFHKSQFPSSSLLQIDGATKVSTRTWCANGPISFRRHKWPVQSESWTVKFGEWLPITGDSWTSSREVSSFQASACILGWSHSHTFDTASFDCSKIIVRFWKCWQCWFTNLGNDVLIKLWLAWKREIFGILFDIVGI